MNRQESHRIYLQLFAPRSASSPQKSRTPGDGGAQLHRHGSHDIHPPNYPTTTPGAPYQFSSSSSLSSTASSYTFSSLSSYTPTPPTSQNRHASQAGSTAPAPHGGLPQKNRFVGYPSTVTTSAAVRLTDKARAKDVTALLRGKFGLPPITSGNSKNQRTNEILSNYYSTQQNDKSKRMPTRLSQVQKDGNNKTNAINSLDMTSKDHDGCEEVDALVLIGTMERPPKGYLRFEHEDFSEEQQRVEVFRHHHFLQQQQREDEEASARQYNLEHNMKMATGMMARLPISESAATVQASGAQPGWTSSSALLAPSASSAGTVMNTSGSDLDISMALGSCTGAIGLDLSSSRAGSVLGGGGAAGAGNRTTQWGSLRGIGAEGAVKDMDFSSSRGKLSTLVSELSVTPNIPSTSPLSPPRTQPKLKVPCYEHDLEPIHIVRTVLPDEHPLHVRDEMMAKLIQLRQKAEDEMGYHLTENENDGGPQQQRQQQKPSFRWYFQPCSPLGVNGSSAQSPKIQSIPAYVDVEGYCTEDESDTDDDDNDEDVTGPLNGADSTTPGPIVSSQMSELIKERQRIAMLRDLSDPSFLVSGYLLKQSWRDPFVWRRVYCVLSDDRMWYIGRMKPLNNSSDVNTDCILSSLRVGRHKYFKLHRSLLIERGEGSGVQSTRQQSSSRYNGYYLTPLNHRLPNTFRVLTSQGQCHTFRAYNSQSFRVWVTSLSEKIAQKAGDDMMDLANVIAEEETLARCRRMDEIAVTPIGDVGPITDAKSSILLDIVRFGIAVAAFRELRRHVNDAIRQYKNHHGNVVNVQTRVGSKVSSRRLSSPNAGQRAKNMEHVGMVSSAWEDARMVASKSAQLLHALATLQHDTLNKDNGEEVVSDGKEEIGSSDRNIIMEELIEEQKGVQAILGKHWDSQQRIDGTASGGECSLPPIQLFDPLLGKLQKNGVH